LRVNVCRLCVLKRFLNFTVDASLIYARLWSVGAKSCSQHISWMNWPEQVDPFSTSGGRMQNAATSVTSTYFILIGGRQGELGRVVCAVWTFPYTSQSVQFMWCEQDFTAYSCGTSEVIRVLSVFDAVYLDRFRLPVVSNNQRRCTQRAGFVPACLLLAMCFTLAVQRNATILRKYPRYVIHHLLL